jgi:hypothetical protein
MGRGLVAWSLPQGGCIWGTLPAPPACLYLVVLAEAAWAYDFVPVLCILGGDIRPLPSTAPQPQGEL